MNRSSFLVVLVGVGILFVATGCQNKKSPDTASGLNRIHFDFDSASINPDMVKTMDSNSRYLKKHSKLKVAVEGHCDERGTNEYNLALGDRRATSAKNYLVNKGVDNKRLKAVSYGEERPVERGLGERTWYMNRRAEFVRQ